jgi:VanZ family protein
VLPLKYPRLWLAIGVLLIVGALVGFLMPARDVDLLKLENLNDKAMHAGVYTLLFIWFAGMLPRSRYLSIAAMLLFMGIAVEFLQGWMAMGRSQDIHDVYANSVGVLAGLLLAFTLFGGWAQRVERSLAGRQ